MLREFIETTIFTKQWHELNLTDEDLRGLQNYLLQNPNAGDIIKGTGGAVKLRWVLPGKGKRGGTRIIFVDFIHLEHLYFLTCYPKKEKIELSPDEKKEIKNVINRLHEYGRRLKNEQ